MEREGRFRVGENTWDPSASRYARVFAVVCGGIQVELDLVIIVPASMKRVMVQPWMLAVLTGQRLLLGDQILMFESGWGL